MIFLVEESRDKKCKKDNNETDACECKSIENLILWPSKSIIDIPESYHIYHYLYKSGHPKNFSMYIIENN